MTIIIGLTGGIGSGKSTVARLFEKLGVAVLDADRAARAVVEPGTGGLEELKTEFGSTILLEDGTLDRRALRRLIFADPKKRVAVEQILHPRIAEELERKAAEIDAPYLLLVIPLLVESSGKYSVDRILLVDLPEELQIERVVNRDQTSRAEVELILEVQASREERLLMADDVILNLDPAMVEAQVKQLHEQYLLLVN